MIQQGNGNNFPSEVVISCSVLVRGRMKLKNTPGLKEAT
jgi:hypothetical protein